MKINTNSWHYWLVETWHPRFPKSDLCSYVRQVIVAAFLLLAAIAMGITVVIIGVATVYAMTAPFWMDGVPNDLRALAAFVWFLLGGLLVVIAKDNKHRYPDHWLFTPIGRQASGTPKPPGLIRQYIQAKKDKICPTLEFVE